MKEISVAKVINHFEIWYGLGRLNVEGLSQILIDKNLKHLMSLADRHNAIEKGRTVWQGTSDELRQQEETVQRYLCI
jgi:branched-chain amino acid transport system ATP-binding protein